VEEQAKFIDKVLKQSLKELLKLDGTALVQQRYQKFKQIGQFTVARDYLGIK
jgi:acetyl-CoA carboxylase carboxyl transferase subunit alpha